MERKQYDEETILTFILIPTYQVQSINTLLFCVDIRAPVSYIGNKVLERMVNSAYRKTIPLMRFNLEFQFEDAQIKFQGMVELFLQISIYIQDIKIITDCNRCEHSRSNRA